MTKPKVIRRAAILSAAALVLLLAAAGLLTAARVRLGRSLTDQRAAERWGGASSAQLSCFFAAGRGPSFDSLYGVARRIDEALSAASLRAEDGARLWYAAASAETTLYASTTRGSATLQATVFFGDYFYIHQPELVSGGYLAAGGANAGYIFLDENAAWRLFGALDVAGMTVTIADTEYVVCGIGRVPHGTVYDEAYGDAPRAWLLSDSAAGARAETADVYEAVLPDPIDGFAADVLAGQFSSDAVLVENSARFTLSALWEGISARKTLGVRTSPVTYPWWENRARVAEYRATSYLIASAWLAGAALLLVLVWLVVLYKPFCALLSRAVRAARDGVEEGWRRLTVPKTKKEKEPKANRKQGSPRPPASPVQ